MLPSTMTTIEMREFGGPDVLEHGSRDVPEVRQHEVLLKTIAAGVNGPDLLQRRGHYPPPKGASDLLGLEVSGEVVAVGAEVSKWKVGDQVCALTNGGGYAEYVAIDANHCLPIPENVSAVDAAGLPETFFTVWSNLFFRQEIQKDSLLLVHGGAGGIGSTAIQLGSALGLKVFTTCSSSDGGKFCEEIGADRVINYKEEDFVEIVREAGGANIILDIVGGDYVARNIKATAPDARIVQLAFNKGSRVEIDLMPIMLKRLCYTGSTLRSRPHSFKADVASDLFKDVWPLFGQGKTMPLTYATFSFDQATLSHETMETGGHKGKILLIPGSHNS